MSDNDVNGEANQSAWYIFTGRGDSKLEDLPQAPPWRRFKGKAPETLPSKSDTADSPEEEGWGRAKTYQTPNNALDAINAALVLRRPLLVTGKPGTGKSTLAYRVAYELGLGPVLVWAINSRSTLKEGLYDYDAIARLNDQRLNLKPGQVEDIGNYITLRALGAALLPSAKPRVVLIDELDKADPDLPNDLLNVFEEGWFEIPELQRHATQEGQEVGVRLMTSTREKSSSAVRAMVKDGHIECAEFPFIVMTSNGEREFPPAFLRRCIRLDLAEPNAKQLLAIVSAHLGPEMAEKAKQQIEDFATSQADKTTATDQLLNALFVVHAVSGAEPVGAAASKLYEMLTQPLD